MHPLKACEYSGCLHQYREDSNLAHIQSVHQTWCQTCQIYMNTEEFASHLSSQHPIIMCPSCPNYSSNHQSEVDDHIHSEHKIGCKICHLRYWSYELKTHYMNQHQIDCTQCLHCQIQFAEGQEQECAQHWVSTHMIPCKYCSQTFVSNDLKVTHSTQEHPSCPVCSLMCYSRAEYDEHMAGHTVCQSCNCSIM